MTGSLLLFVATVISLELLRALRLMRRFGDLGALGARSSRLLLRTGVSEWAKERAMRLMALKLFGHSLRTGLVLALVAVPIGLSLLLAPAPKSWIARGLLLAATIAWSLARRRMTVDRGAGERLLQRLALGTAPVREISFDLERAQYRAKLPPDAGARPIFVAGLARAGTTMLTRLLQDSGEMASLSYRDLPFPLAPNLWARVTARSGRHVAAVERGHGDGILHDLDSPEAIEEIFWGHFEGARFCRRDGLSPVPPQPETIAAFHDYVGLVRLRHGGGRYLSKNNANVLRLPALVSAFPDAVLLHPFRDPLQQAASLRSQHLRATAMAVTDPFRCDFMRWLGHHEFGADQRPFLLGQGAAPDEDRMGLEYWLWQWIAVHRFLLDQPAAVAARQVLVDYDALCVVGDAAAPALAARLGLKGLSLAVLRAPAPRPVEAVRPTLMAEAYELHEALVERAGGATATAAAAAAA